MSYRSKFWTDRHDEHKTGTTKMGSIIERTRKDGSKAFTAQIVIKKGGVIVHREAETFDRKQAANAWVVKREAELKSPGGLERKEDPTLSAVIDRLSVDDLAVYLDDDLGCKGLGAV